VSTHPGHDKEENQVESRDRKQSLYLHSQATDDPTIETPDGALVNRLPQEHVDSLACQLNFNPHSHIQPLIRAGEPTTSA